MFIQFQGFPSLDIQDGILRSWWIDPLIATLAFAIFIRWYWHYEKKQGLTSEKCDCAVFIYSGSSYWAGIYIWKCIVPPASHKIPDGIPTSLSELLCLILEIASGIVLYDAIFFFIHWAMHEVRFLRRIHLDHHSRPNGTLESRDVLRHSLVDGSLQVLVNIMVQRHTPWGSVKSRLARAVHNVLVIWMLTESHAAASFPYIWRRWFVGVREHRLHHLVGERTGPSSCMHHRYQQFFGYLDDLRSALGNKNYSRSKRTKRS